MSMQEFDFTNGTSDSNLNKYNGNPDYAIIYITTYLPFKNSEEHPYLYSGSSWCNNQHYLGSSWNHKYDHIWQVEVREHPERFHKEIVAVFDKKHITKEDLRKIESDFQKTMGHVKDKRYFNVSDRSGGPGITSEAAILLRAKDPEKWKKIDKESALKAAETMKNWSPERKKLRRERLSKAHKGRKITWNKELTEARLKRPKCTYYMVYTFQTPEGNINTAKQWTGLKTYLTDYNKNKPKVLKCSAERLVKEKSWKGFKILEIKQVNTEGKPDIIKYRNDS